MKINEFWRKGSTSQKVIYVLYIFSFLIATSTHTREIITGGLLPYTNYPLWANTYWTLLTLFDPLAIIILCFSLKIGRILYATIIISDVVINLYFTISNSGFMGIFNIYMLGQLLFLFFLIVTWNILKQGKIEKKQNIG